MRVIKFRGWHIPSKTWLTHEESLSIIMLQGRTIAKQADGSDLLDRHIIEQFTGLLDSQGKEIYEGDIITCCNATKAEIKFGEFEYTCDCIDGENMDHIGFYFSPTMEPFAPPISANYSYEIIGNIHTDSHLLEK